jgi:flagellin-like protein
MKLQRLTDDTAVSPVIGVILMVAITVILAAVIGTFVLGLGSGVTQTSPQASFEFQYDSGDLTITHASGDKMPESEVYIKGYSGGPTTTDWTGNSNTDDEFSAGSTVTISGVADSDTVRVVWESPDGDTSVLGVWEGPAA